MKCKPRNFSLWFILVIIKNKNYGIGYKVLKHLIVAFWGCLTYQKVTRIKFAKVEKNTKMSSTRPNYIHIANERYLSLNDSLWIVLARTFWTNWTGSNIFYRKTEVMGGVLVSITFICFLKQQWFYYVINDFFYNQYPLMEKSWCKFTIFLSYFFNFCHYFLYFSIYLFFI